MQPAYAGYPRSIRVALLQQAYFESVCDVPTFNNLSVYYTRYCGTSESLCSDWLNAHEFASTSARAYYVHDDFVASPKRCSIVNLRSGNAFRTAPMNCLASSRPPSPDRGGGQPCQRQVSRLPRHCFLCLRIHIRFYERSLCSLPMT